MKRKVKDQIRDVLELIRTKQICLDVVKSKLTIILLKLNEFTIDKDDWIYECKECGRKNYFRFYHHATSKIANDCCNGKIRRIKVKNMW